MTYRVKHQHYAIEKSDLEKLQNYSEQTRLTEEIISISNSSDM